MDTPRERIEVPVHHLIAERYYYTFGPNPPAIRVRPGCRVVADTRDARGLDAHGAPLPDEQKQRSVDTDFRESNPLVGPIYVEVALHPFIGSIGVAPRFGRVEMSLTPGEYGGNMDCADVCEGITLLLPVWVRGAYLAFGDVHAAQGDGELCGSALEISANVTLKIDLLKARHAQWPLGESDEWLLTFGSGRPLQEALNIAVVEMIDWLEREHKFDRVEALQVLSQTGRLRVGNVVDPNYTVVAMFPKRLLTTG